MSRMLRITKEWFPATAGVGLAVAATVFAVARASEVGAKIRHSNSLAAALNTSAKGVEQGIMSPEETSALQSRRHDLVLRMRDSMKQIVPQISEAARNAGLTILEIAPKLATPKLGEPKERQVYPHYRVMVIGSYQDIAEFMQGCGEQRIPVRVTSFRISQSEDRNFIDPDLLRAEITVEAFQASQALLERLKET